MRSVFPTTNDLCGPGAKNRVGGGGLKQALWCLCHVLLSLSLVLGAAAELPGALRGGQPRGDVANQSATPVLMAALQMPVSSMTPDFSLTLSQQALSVGRGLSGTVAVQAGDSNGFNSQIALSCAGMPAGTSCAFAPSMLNPGGMATLTISVSKTASPYRMNSAGLMGSLVLSGMGLVGLLVPVRRTKFSRKAGLGWRLSGLALLLGLLLSVAGCGYSSPMNMGIGTKNIMVMGTSGMLQHSAPLSLTVM